MPEIITLVCDVEGCGIEITGAERGAGSAAFKMGGHKRRSHGIAGTKRGSTGRPPGRPRKVPLEPPPSVEAEVSDDAPAEVYAERMPTDPAVAKKKEGGGLLGKLWDRGSDSSKDKGEGAPKTSERKPAAPKRRSSTADFWGDLTGPAAAISARAGYVPMARAMVWSAPVVGEIIEDATKGTPVDRMVQPFVRNSEKWQDLFDLLGFWGAVGVAQRNPAQAGQALDFARKRLVNLLPRIASNIRKERAKEKAAVDALVELMPDIRELFPEAGPDDDPVGLLIQSLFAAPAMDEEPVGV